MRRHREPDAISDGEVVELLRDEPELLAIADAIHATLGEQYGRRRRRKRIVRVGAAVAVISTAAALAFVQPWGGRGGGLVAEALAAIPGEGPIVHAVLESPLPGVEIVDLRNGRARQEQVEFEFWFDPRHDLLRTLVRRQGVVVTDVLASPGRTVAAAGPVLGRGSPPSLDPALLAFASGYRQALASGAAHPAGRTLAAGHAAPLVEVTTRFGREQVVLDPKTLRPRELRALLPNGRPSGQSARVLTLATLPASPSHFARPRRGQPGPTGGAVATSTTVTLAQARQALPRPALWAGQHLVRLPLRLLARQRLARFISAPAAATRRSSGRGLDLIYGAVRGGRPDWRSRFLEIQQAPTPEPAYGFLPGLLRIEPLPQPGLLRLQRQPLAGNPGHAIWRGELRRGGLYIALTGSSRALVLTAAGALRPIPSLHN